MSSVVAFVASFCDKTDDDGGKRGDDGNEVVVGEETDLVALFVIVMADAVGDDGSEVVDDESDVDDAEGAFLGNSLEEVVVVVESAK